MLRRNILGHSIKEAKLNLDPLIFPALKTASDPESTLEGFKGQLTGSTVESVGRHGKYFWVRLVKPKVEPTVMLMHFGMTGMIKIRDVESHMIFMENGGDKKVLKTKEAKALKSSKEEDTESDATQDKETDTEAEWPPRFTKFELVLEKKTGDVSQTLDLAFRDPRRLARVRLISGPKTDEELLKLDPLASLGPDYSKNPEGVVVSDFTYGDPDPHHHGRPRLGLENFGKLILSRKKIIKSLLLDQTHFAGIGNWVGDEILYHARIHPEDILSSKLSGPGDALVEKLYKAIIYIMEESVRVEGNARQFPDDWLMLYRWGKGRKDKKTTKEGHSVDYVTVGGRTSCFVPELQKPLKSIKTEDGELPKPAKRKAKAAGAKKKRKVKEELDTDGSDQAYS